MRSSITLAATLVFSVVNTIFAQAPDPLSFQGFVTNPGGVPIDDPSASITFKLYEGSSEIWTETQPSVEIVGGVFNVHLGTVVPLDSVRFDRSLSLGIKIDTDPEITPRSVLAAAAYARALPGLYTFYQDAGDGDRSYNVIGGDPNNVIGPGITGATIGGGGGEEDSEDAPNQVLASWGTVAGGYDNIASGRLATVSGGYNGDATGGSSVVAGGAGNKANGSLSTVGGGGSNRATGSHATVPGGSQNWATQGYTFAAGRRAQANHSGSFVWADSLSTSGEVFATTGPNQFLIRASGGIGVGTGDPGADLHIAANSNGNKPHILLLEEQTTGYARFRLKNNSNTEYWDVAAGSTDNDRLNFFSTQGRNDVMSLRATGTPVVMYNGATLTDGGIWTNASSLSKKTDFVEINPKTILEGLAALPVRQWRYKVEPDNVIHIGPTAEDFNAMFGLGESTESIGTVDADGVSLAAIQGLYKLVKEQAKRIDELERRLARQ